MSGNLYVDLVYFFIYSFTGWCCETAYCSVLQRKFVNRGFLTAPICPIYGFGALMMIAVLSAFPRNIFLVFFVGALLTTILEYITSWSMEKLFKARWWDYSDHKFNICGRVCLENSLMFGGLCVLLLFILHPRIQALIQLCPPWLIQVIAVTGMIGLAVDATITVQSIISLNETLKRMQQATIQVKAVLEKKQLWLEEHMQDTLLQIKENVHQKTEGLEQMLSEMKKLSVNVRGVQKRILRAYPKYRTKTYKVQLEELKQLIYERYTRHKNKDR